MTRTVHLARHGQTVWHAENRYAGVSDVPLTRQGREQAGALATWADAVPLALVASSGLTRAVETAAEVAAVAGLPHVVEPDLREVDFGRAEGMTRSEMRTAFPDALDAFLAAPASSPLPGGEPGAAAADRFLAAVLTVLAPVPPDEAVLVVAHTTVLRLALCSVLGLPLDGYRRRFPALGNATVTTLRLPEAEDLAGLRGAGALLAFNTPAG